MTGATLCSGIGAPEVAAPWIDWRWCAEIEPFPSAVLAHHWPHSQNLGDITAEDFEARAAQYGPIDVLVAGTPCQAFSIAGQRESLADDRGNLTLRLVEIVRSVNPRYLLWENVPGVFSTGDNAFGCFLAGLIGADSALPAPTGRKWPSAGVVDGPRGAAAWRTLDAQYFGVAQRRKRVFLVFRSGSNGLHPAEVLFEFDGLRRDFAPSRETGQAITGTLTSNAGGGGGLGGFDLNGGLQACEIGPSGGRYTALAPTLDTRAKDGPIRNQLAPAVICAKDFNAKGGSGSALRRLTPKECERLQGFPDGYTEISFRGRPAADGPRYKALGNSMAVPVVKWILQRLPREFFDDHPILG